MIYFNNANTLAMRILGEKYTAAEDEYLRRHYSHISMEWTLPPSFLWMWYEEDLEQFQNGTFEDDENENLRIIRSALYDLAFGVNEMFEEHTVTQSEAKVLYETLYWIYLNRRLEVGHEVKAQEKSEDLKFDEKVIYR